MVSTCILGVSLRRAHLNLLKVVGRVVKVDLSLSLDVDASLGSHLVGPVRDGPKTAGADVAARHRGRVLGRLFLVDLTSVERDEHGEGVDTAQVHGWKSRKGTVSRRLKTQEGKKLTDHDTRVRLGQDVVQD